MHWPGALYCSFAHGLTWFEAAECLLAEEDGAEDAALEKTSGAEAKTSLRADDGHGVPDPCDAAGARSASHRASQHHYSSHSRGAGDASGSKRVSGNGDSEADDAGCASASTRGVGVGDSEHDGHSLRPGARQLLHPHEDKGRKTWAGSVAAGGSHPLRMQAPVAEALAVTMRDNQASSLPRSAKSGSASDPLRHHQHFADDKSDHEARAITASHLHAPPWPGGRQPTDGEASCEAQAYAGQTACGAGGRR